MNIKKTLKTPIFWLVLFIIVGLIVIFVLTKPKPQPTPVTCKDDETRISCDGEIVCAPKCSDDRYYDCNTRKCQCKTPKISCQGDSVCCDVCENDTCCTSDRQIIVDGKISCCGPGTYPDADTKTKCLTVCGIEGGPCGLNQECNKITGLSKATYDDMIEKHSSEDTWRGSKWDDISKSGEVYFCSDPPKCMWTESQALPHAVGDAYTNYDMSGLSGEGFNSLCLPKDGDTSCYGKAQSSCDSDKCDWVNVLDSYSKDDTALEKRLNDWNNSQGRSVLGYYCGSSGRSWGRLQKVIKDPASAECKWQDCYNRLSNTGTVDIVWDESNNTCSALKSANTNTGIQSLVKCKGPGDPCSSCIKADDYANCIKCNKQGDPCKECEDREFIPADKCTSTIGWKFQDCEPDNKNVLKYDSTQTENFGNCPWGCNDPNSQQCMNTIGDAPYVFGQELAGTSEVCYNDGQVKNFNPNYWRASAPPSAKACSEENSDNCQNPGKAICKSSKEPCGEDEAGCYGTQTECEKRNTCQPGWLRNNDKTDCNVFQCTEDGSLVNRDVPAGQIAENANNLFHVNEYGGACLRTNPKVNPDDSEYCRLNVWKAKCEGGTANKNEKIGKNYKAGCNYAVARCNGWARDNLPKFMGNPGGPDYKFAYDTASHSKHLLTDVNDAHRNGLYPTDWGPDKADASIDEPADGIPKYP